MFCRKRYHDKSCLSRCPTVDLTEKSVLFDFYQQLAHEQTSQK